MTQEKEDSATSRQKKMADKNFLKNKWKMVGNELKNRIYRRTRKKKKKLQEKRRPEEGGHHENKLKYRKKRIINR